MEFARQHNQQKRNESNPHTSFHERFQNEYIAFSHAIQNPPSITERQHLAILLLTRLMFIYFIQKKGFLDGNINYLPDKLRIMQERMGQNTFLSFYRHLLLRLFHEESDNQQEKRTPALDHLLGHVPFLNTDLFEVSELEHGYRNIQIPDEAFARIFAFFDSYQWQIDEQPLHHDHEINPAVIGYIFEKYINQKQMGAYYTSEDITEYISKNAIIPYIFNATQQQCGMAFSADGPIWYLLRSNPDRYIPASMRNEEYLPTESKREYIARHARYAEIKTKLSTITSINDFITYNLDIRRFAHDALLNCTDSALLRAFYESITHITVLDPTCGSGAFLFAALNILESLYTACLARMHTMLADRDSYNHTDLEFFHQILKQVDAHPNRSYFILKAITINNLYGIDIMKEAVEICELRLFLKLIAQLKSVDEIESLPDIDFNIRPGNALVGFAHYDDIKQEFVSLRQRQALLEPGPDNFEVGKKFRRIVIKPLEAELNRYLAREYGIDRLHMSNEEDYERAFAQWLASHRPFHSFVEFYGIMERGGFDVIIGNPPYVEYSKVKQEYRLHGYQTESCGNLYAAVIERSLALCRPGQSYLGLIVPLSVCGSERFGPLRDTLTHNTGLLWLANFEIFPSRLFDGAFQRLSILIACHDTTHDCAMHVTRIQRWYASERPHLINLISYTATQCCVRPGVFPRLASPLQEGILHKVLQKARGSTIAQVLHPRKTVYFVYYQEATNYWMKATCRVPYYKKNGIVMEPVHGRFLYFRDALTAQTIMALM
ncbi:MAG: Eco57I restriction-modification methylase domain-containing protein, partial [Chloroflexi bacterium]|nr:Eco57I restriction-modification methylase domain-containing protein [Chloroflexota bacterium]